MTATELEKLQYPIGKFEKPETITFEILKNCIEHIAAFPKRLQTEVAHLS